jgi:hypothetical protein
MIQPFASATDNWPRSGFLGKKMEHLDPTTIAALIALAVLVVNTIGAILLAFMNYKTQALLKMQGTQSLVLDNIDSKTTQLEVNTNNKFDKLLEMTSASSYAEGKLASLKEEREVRRHPTPCPPEGNPV